MKYSILDHISILAATLMLFCACSDELVPAGASEPESAERGEVINVGVDLDEMIVSSAVSRATDDHKPAETVSWLVQPLMQGLDITYGNVNNGQKFNQRVAILKLQRKSGGAEYEYETDLESGLAKYTFNYRSESNGSETEEPARWYDNGMHFFEGVHVPNRIRYTSDVTQLESNKPNDEDIVFAAVKDLTTDQSQNISTGNDNQLSNYYLLSHYLGMPANTQMAATVARIKLPFRHRLARVLAYILIDPELKTNGVAAKILGYENSATSEEKFRDDPATSSIRFCNVDVLEGVHDEYNETTKVHKLTPKWAEKVRKVVPHFTEQLESFKVYDSDKKTYFQGTSNFPSSKPAGFDEINYTNVPVYDLIVRPTYTSTSNVMYDEDLTGTSTQAIAAKKNQILFTVSLDNGLTYEKHFEFDLDANYQTKVYLRITREGVSYKESGSELWVESRHDDSWYGVDNQNGQTLSAVGSSWQRAYYNTILNADDKITDGGFYDENTSGEDGTKGQYVSDTTWIKNFAQAYEGGAHHGDYFVLAKDITLDARSLPDNFIFTGHLDGFNTHGSRNYHTITVTNMGQPWKEYKETTDYTVTTPLYIAKPAEEPSNDEGEEFPKLLFIKYNEEEIATACAYFDKPFSEDDENYEAMRKITSSYPDYIKETVNVENDPSHKIPEIMGNNGIVYYTRSVEKGSYVYRKFEKPTVVYEKIEHTSPQVLFAGLNGVYSTKQEDEETAGRPIYNQTWQWEANVHKEGNYWLPYKDAATKTGWRAEVMNLKVSGCKMFKDGAVITGNVQNCHYIIDGTTTAVKDHTPAYPKYK